MHSQEPDQEQQNQEQFDIRFDHLRCYDQGSEYLPKHVIREQGRTIHPRGGVTVCRVYDQTGALLADADAVCSDNDNFSYAIGRAIASGRALKKLRDASYSSAYHVQADAAQQQDMDQFTRALLTSLGVDPDGPQVQHLGDNMYAVNLTGSTSPTVEEQEAAHRAYNDAEYRRKLNKGLGF